MKPRNPIARSLRSPHLRQKVVERKHLFRRPEESAEEYQAALDSVANRCGLCNRLLNQPNEPLSLDCGGDCLGCMKEAEGFPDD